jgi:hypothetical protein
MDKKTVDIDSEVDYVDFSAPPPITITDHLQDSPGLVYIPQTQRYDIRTLAGQSKLFYLGIIEGMPFDTALERLIYD